MAKFYDKSTAGVEAFRFDPLVAREVLEPFADKIYQNVVSPDKFVWYANPTEYPLNVSLGDYIYKQNGRWRSEKPEYFEQRYGKLND